jgi:DNA repair protein RadC
MKMKDVPKFDRPREKLERYGVRKLGEHELLAILLGSGVRGTNVVELSKKITKLITKTGLEHITLELLLGVNGLGKVKALQILAALEFGRRAYAGIPEVILAPEKVFELCEDMRSSKREHFVAFYLNSRNAVIAREIISVGTLDASLVHPREVFEPALRHGAAVVLVAHNHPSGDPQPSREDREITRCLTEAGKVMGIELADHVIVTKSNFLSFKQSTVIS